MLPSGAACRAAPLSKLAWFEPAIRRWEAVTGVPAPLPTVPGSRSNRVLNPALVLKYSEGTRLDPFAVSGKASLALFNELVDTASIGVQH